ncbi:MAG TPA: hypothetical protein PKE46_02250, partial [Micropruina sp.]|nr:hypothetical protein [Micropruina sp.]
GAVAPWGVMGGVAPLIGRLEYALIPPLGTSPGRGAIGAYLLLTAGTGLVWLNGTVLHPSRPWSLAGLVLLAAGMAWLARAARTGSVSRR